MARHRTQGKRPGIVDRYTEARYAWAQMPKFEAVIYHGDQLDDAEPIDETQHDPMAELNVRPIRLLFRYPNRKISFNLTAWTEQELNAFQEIINEAIECARPAVQALDAAADAELQEGSDSNPRLFRPDPALHYRERLRPDYTHLTPTKEEE